MKKARKHILIPEDNIKLLNEKAERMGIDANALINILVAGVVGNEDYQKTMQVISQVAPIGQKNTP